MKGDIKMKKFLILIIALSFFLPNAAVKAQDNPFAITAPVTIEWWHALEDQYTEDIQRIVGIFMEQNPMITVEPVYVGSYGEVNSKLIAAIAAGDVPAISAASVQYLSEYFSSGIAENLEPYFEAYDIDKNDFVQGYRASGTFSDDGNMYALPFQASTQVIYYNKSVTDAENIPLPEAWEEMDAFLEAATQFNEDGTTKRWGFILAGWQPHYFQTLFTNYGVEIIKEDGMTTGIADPISIEIVKQIKGWIDKGYLYMAYGSGASATMRQLFWDQNAVAVVHTCSLITTYADKIGDNFDLDLIGFPEINGKTDTLLSGNFLIIPKKALQAEKNAAFLFGDYMTSGEASLLWAEVSGYLPGRYSTMESKAADVLIERLPAFEQLFNNVDSIQPRDESQSFQTIADEWMVALAKIFKEDAPVEATLQEAAELIEEILADE